MGIGTELSSNDSGMPPGVVNGPCTPSPSHPYPVVLVHGTFANENFSWQTLAPLLSDAGYCVFGLNYGATSWTTTYGDHTYGIDYVERSAQQLESFIAGAVLPDTFEPANNAAGYAEGTHPAQVDMVGHSQGGMMPRYLINTTSSSWYPGLGDAAHVHTMVGLAPSNHGTDAEGLVPVFARLFGSNVYSFPTSAGCPACGEQEAGSPFLQALNGQPDAAGVNQYVIESNKDEFVTPYTSSFLPTTENVQDVTLQSQCPTDLTDHIGIIYDPVALQDVMNALANNGTTATQLPQPSCPAAVLPVLSG
jgi:pimeloyl-ACP methyl ester carboxylesterase